MALSLTHMHVLLDTAPSAHLPTLAQHISQCHQGWQLYLYQQQHSENERS